MKKLGVCLVNNFKCDIMENVVTKLKISVLIYYFILYIVLHIIIGIIHNNAKKNKDINNKKSLQFYKISKLLFKWFPFIYVIFVLSKWV